jgi:methionyl aminopeptidase
MKKINKIYDVNHKLAQVMSSISKNIIKEGVNIADIDSYFFETLVKEKNLYPSILGFEDFPKASCISVNNVICHGVPYSHVLKSGDIVTVDVCAYNGYHSDMADTFAIGKISGQHKSLIKTTKMCLDEAISICKPGIPYNKIGEIVEKISNENGFEVVKGFRGHGIGKRLHMKPYIPNYATNKNIGVMKEGDTFCIEPLLAIDSGAHFVGQDGFSVLTKNGKYSAHFERCIMITNAGHEVLNVYQ